MSEPTPVQPVAYTANGQPIDDEHLHQAIAAGEAHFQGGVPVHFVGQDGSRYSVPGELAWQEIKRGNTPLTNAQFAHHEELKASQQSMGDVGAAAALGLARTASFGLSDVAANTLAPGYKEKAALLEEAHPAATLAGEIGGYAVPGLGELGIGGKAVKAAGGMGRGVSAVARGTERLVTGGMKEGLAKKVVGTAVAGGIEGAAYGAGSALSENVIHDEPVTAQRILFDSAAGAALGGLLGGVSHFAGKALDKGAGGVMEPELAAGKAELAKPSLLEPAVTPEVATGKPSLMQRAVNWARGNAADAEVGQMLKSAGYQGADIAKMAEGDAPRIAQRIRDLGPARNVSEVAQKAEVARKAAGESLGSLVDDLDSAGINIDRTHVVSAFENRLNELRTSNIPENARIANQIDSKYLKLFRGETEAPFVERAKLVAQRAEDLTEQLRTDLAEKGWSDRQVNRYIQRRLNDQGDELFKFASEQLDNELGKVQPPPVKLKDLWEFRQRIDKFERFKFNDSDTATVRKAEIRKIRDEIEASVVKQIREQAGPDVANAYVQGKLQYRDFKQLAEVAADRAAHRAGNRMIGLSEQLGTGAGIVAGTAATGHVLAGGAMGVLGFVASKVAKSSIGTRVSSKVLHAIAGDMSKLTEPELIRSAGEVSERIGKSVGDTLQKGEHRITDSMRRAAAYQIPVVVTKGAATVGQLIQHLRQTRNDMDTSGQTALAQLGQHPEMMSEVTGSQLMAKQMLVDAIPHADQPYNPALGEHQPPPPASQAHQYAEMIRMLDRPARLLDHLQAGTITRQQVQLIHALSPAVADDMTHAVTASLARQVKAGKTPSYQRRLQAGLLGAPLDSSDTPEVTAGIQTIYASMSLPAQQQRGSTPRTLSAKRQERLAARRQTESERMIGD